MGAPVLVLCADNVTLRDSRIYADSDSVQIRHTSGISLA